jgi:hypothetical protein
LGDKGREFECEACIALLRGGYTERQKADRTTAASLPHPLPQALIATGKQERQMKTVKIRNLMFGDISDHQLSDSHAEALGLSDGDEFTPAHFGAHVVLVFQEIEAHLASALRRK